MGEANSSPMDTIMESSKGKWPSDSMTLNQVDPKHLEQNNSPEIFLLDDNIINTQDSQAQDGDGAAQDDTPQVATSMTIPDVPKMADMKLAQERRRSERLMKETMLTTQEKTERMAKKRNLEGNTSNQNMFSTLANDVIAELSASMGINPDNNDYATFDLLKDLECARQELYSKEMKKNQNTQAETVGGLEEPNSPLLLEWLQDESSDAEDFTLVLSKKKARAQKKLKIASNSKNGSKTQENPGLVAGKSRKSTKPPIPKQSKTKKSSKYARSYLELQGPQENWGCNILKIPHFSISSSFYWPSRDHGGGL